MSAANRIRPGIRASLTHSSDLRVFLYSAEGRVVNPGFSARQCVVPGQGAFSMGVITRSRAVRGRAALRGWRRWAAPGRGMPSVWRGRSGDSQEPVGLGSDRLRAWESGPFFRSLSLHSPHYAPRETEKMPSLSRYVRDDRPSPTGSQASALRDPARGGTATGPRVVQPPVPVPARRGRGRGVRGNGGDGAAPGCGGWPCVASNGTAHAGGAIVSAPGAVGTTARTGPALRPLRSDPARSSGDDAPVAGTTYPWRRSRRPGNPAPLCLGSVQALLAALERETPAVSRNVAGARISRSRVCRLITPWLRSWVSNRLIVS